MTETIGERLFKIRAACGRGERDPETLDDFAVRVAEATGVRYNPVTLSLLERGKRHWRVRDVETFAQIDPLHRGREWLAFGDEPRRIPHPDASRSGAEMYYGEDVGTGQRADAPPIKKAANERGKKR